MTLAFSRTAMAGTGRAGREFRIPAPEPFRCLGDSLCLSMKPAVVEPAFHAPDFPKSLNMFFL